MNSDEKPDISEVVFLTGAGISIPVAIPGMQGIYDAFQNSANITPTEKKTCHFFTEKIGVARDLEEFLLAANAVTEFKTSSLAPFIDRAISERKGTRRLRDYQTRLDNLIKDAVALRKRILDFMSKTCFRFDREKSCAIFGEFVNAISKKGCPVYSTNYDSVFEYVAMERSIAIEDNFPRQGQRYLWNPNVEFRLGNALTLIKLHGSVTWYVDENGNLEKIYADTAINPVGKDIDRLVIFPTRFKDIYDQHFFSLYCHFLSTLSNARVLVVLGHSLRDDYIRAGIIERYRKYKFQIIIVDPVFPKALLAEFTPARLGTSGDVTHVPYKFEEFSDELSNLILNTSPSDLVNDCTKIVRRRTSKSNKLEIRGKIGSLKPRDIKTFTAIVDAYLLPHEKPAYVRIWLAAVYSTPSEQNISRVSHEFLDKGKFQVCTGLTGMLQQNIPLRIEVPNYSEWLKYASKVTLHVALIQKTVRTPAQLKKRDIIVADKRKLMYTS